MSADTISRWNAIPMSRSEQPNSKRPREDDGEGNDEDDNMSIVSRSPSPSVDVMDVDDQSLSKYDEYVRGVPREVITVETRIKPTNKGFAMLAKLGWAEGQPLGLSGDGRIDPIPFQIKNDATGLGKNSQDVRMIETTVSQRRGLDSERQTKETEEQRRAREENVARRTALQSEISTTLKAFYCSLCDKQFKNVAQYDEHTNSYAHHHKARFKDMQANVRLKDKDEADKRKEKEKKREEKELRKIAAAAGIKLPKPSVAPLVPTAEATSSDSTAVNNMEVEPKHTGFKKSSWASFSTTEVPETSSRRSGWATVNSSSAALPLDSPHSSGGWPRASTSASTNTAQTPQSPIKHAPSFRTAGWTSLDTGSSHSIPPPPPPSASFPPLGNTPAPTAQGWSSVPLEPREWTELTQPPHVPPSFVPVPPSFAPPLPPTAPTTQPGQSSWQQFQKSTFKKR